MERHPGKITASCRASRTRNDREPQRNLPKSRIRTDDARPGENLGVDPYCWLSGESPHYRRIRKSPGSAGLFSRILCFLSILRLGGGARCLSNHQYRKPSNRHSVLPAMAAEKICEISRIAGYQVTLRTTEEHANRPVSRALPRKFCAFSVS